jgi:hypothetical protein
MARRFIPIHANGKLAFGTYREEDGAFVGNAIHVITLRGEEITDMVAFLTPRVLPAFGLPERLSLTAPTCTTGPSRRSTSPRRP